MGPTELLEKFVSIVEQLGIDYFITGCVASTYYGEPHFTNDIDAVVELQEKDVESFCRAFPSPDYYLTSGKPVRLASAEDIILRKMEYFREGGSEKHLRDIAGILRIQNEHLDRTYIHEWAERLGMEDIWNTIAAREAQM